MADRDAETQTQPTELPKQASLSPAPTPFPQRWHPGLGDPRCLSQGMGGGSRGCPAPTAAPEVLGAHVHSLGMGPWGGPTSLGCFRLLGGGVLLALPPLPTPPGLVDHQETMLRQQRGGAEIPGVNDGIMVTPQHLSAASPAGGCKPGHPGARLPPPAAPRHHRGRRRQAQAGTPRAAPRAGGVAGGRLDFEGSLEPAEDSGSVILRGMQFPQQQRVRGQRGEPAARSGLQLCPGAAEEPPG